MTLSESYYQTILTYSELISNSIHIFTELLLNNSKHFWGEFETDRKFSNEKFPSKSKKS